MTAPRVLVIDDDASFRFAMKKALSRLGYEVSEAASGQEALPHLIGSDPPDAALLDLRMDGIDGIEVLKRRGSCPTRIVVLTGHGTVQAAVDAMRLGAFSFLEKPVDAELLQPLLAQAVNESRRATGGAEGDSLPPLVGTSSVIDAVRKFIARVGPTDETVAIYGETGTGKEIVAHHLHLASARAKKPFIALNAACVPRELFESELFGHRKGSFTGATSDRPGLFRDADGGTLFIDELAELPLESQAKLLRALESRTIRPVGETHELPVDVRIVAATNRDLWSEVRLGRFREDLYFRLQVLPVMLPPLRARASDISLLSVNLLERMGVHGYTITSDARDALESYEWPGNVRELLNVLRRAVLFAEGHLIDGDLIRRMLAASVFAHAHAQGSLVQARSVPAPQQAPQHAPSSEDASHPITNLADVERAHIERVLSQMEGNITRAAIALGIDRRTLQRKMRGYGIESGES